MARFTVEVKDICEVLAEKTEPTGGNDIDALIKNAIPLIFNKPQLALGLESMDDAYLQQLFYAILAHYYRDEIGYETYALWRFKLNTKLSEILPYYDQFYRTQLLKYNILDNVDYTENHEGKDSQQTTGSKSSTGSTKSDATITDTFTRTDATTRDANSKGTNAQKTTDTGTIQDAGTNTSSSTDLHSDTPQGGVFISDISKHNYLTDARTQSTNGSDGNTRTLDTINDANGSTTGEVKETGSLTRNDKTDRSDGRTGETSEDIDTTGSMNATDEYVNHVVGLKGNTFVNLIKEFRENVINVNMMIIDELNPLFMGLWE